MALVLDTFARANRRNLSNLLISRPQMVKYPHFIASTAVFFSISFLDSDKVVTFPQSHVINGRPLLKILLSHLTFMRTPVTVNGERREIRRRPHDGFNIRGADELRQALKLPLAVLLNQMSNGQMTARVKKTFPQSFFSLHSHLFVIAVSNYFVVIKL